MHLKNVFGNVSIWNTFKGLDQTKMKSQLLIWYLMILTNNYTKSAFDNDFRRCL